MEELNYTKMPSAEHTKVPTSDAVFAWASLALGFIFTHFTVSYFGGVWGGIIWALFGIMGAAFVKVKSIKIKPTQAVIFGVAELFCLTPIFSASLFINILAALFSFALYLYLTIVISGAELFGQHFISDLLQSVFVRPFENFSRQPKSAFSVFRERSRSRKMLYALLGLLIAIPLTIVVVALLMSSDELFSNSMRNFTEHLPNLSPSLFWEIVFAIPIAMYLFGTFFSVQKNAPEHSETAPKYRILPQIASYFAVTPICVFYLVYVITQFVNIANAINKTLDYSAFARRGFFELCAIAVINLAVIALIQTFTKRNEYDVKPLALRVYAIVISLFTLLIIATAITKMLMYIDEYGMTLLRVYTSWFMILLALIFVLIIALQIHNFVIWKAAFAVFTVMFAILCFGNFEGLIARYNISAYQSGKLSELDISEFNELGYPAVRPAAELLESGALSDNEIKQLRDFLKNERYIDENRDKFAYFSIPRAKAQSAISRLNI